MILSNIIIPKLANQCFKFYSPDSLSDCHNRKHFKNYPHDITYRFNSRGFRDTEWPDDLENAIWCLGDSATAALGSPIDHSWPSQLNQLTGMPVINLGIRAIDNYTISTVAREILVNVQPKNMLILWSFFERRPVSNIQTEIIDKSEQLIVDDEFEHYNYFINCRLNLVIPNNKTNIVHGLLPKTTSFYHLSDLEISKTWNDVRDSSWPEKIENIDTIDPVIVEELRSIHNVYDRLKKLFNWNKFKNEYMKNRIADFDQVDLARDAYHWGIDTNKLIADKFSSLLKK
jgi:hypothetical protein